MVALIATIVSKSSIIIIIIIIIVIIIIIIIYFILLFFFNEKPRQGSLGPDGINNNHSGYLLCVTLLE